MTNTTPVLPTVLFVVVPAQLGGSNRSMADVLRSLEGKVNRVLAGPGFGGFIDLVREEGLADELIVLPRRPGSPLDRLLRIAGGLKVAWWAILNRRRLMAIHANALTGLNLSLPAAVIVRRNTVVWIHDPVGSRWGAVLGPIIRWLIPGLHIAAVSPTAEKVAVDNRLCDTGDAIIVPNPIDPAEVRAPSSGPGETPLSIGVLGGASSRKGFDLMPDVILAMSDEPVAWRLYVSSVIEPGMEATWSKLHGFEGEKVEINPKVADVRQAYSRLDIVFCPSRQESFCRVAAEAMLNGLPVVASDIEPLRRLLGDDEAGFLFPTGDVGRAVSSLKALVADPALRSAQGDQGRRRAAAFEPVVIADQLLGMYTA